MGNGKNMGEINHARKIDLDWGHNVHVIKFAPMEPSYVSVESFNIPNNSITVIRLADKYLLVVSNDDGDFIETFESFEELNNYLKQYFKVELNTPPWG
jgi:hypothetical protein